MTFSNGVKANSTTQRRGEKCLTSGKLEKVKSVLSIHSQVWAAVREGKGERASLIMGRMVGRQLMKPRGLGSLVGSMEA